MLSKTYFTGGHDRFSDDRFSADEWSAPYMVDADEIKERIGSYPLVGLTIKELRFPGCCYNLFRERIEDAAYDSVIDSGKCDPQSVYQNIPGDFLYPRFTAIDEPLQILLEEKTEDPERTLTGTFEIDTPQVPEFRMSMNSLPWDIRAGTNPANADANVLLSPCIGKKIVGVEVKTYFTDRDPMLHDAFPDGAEKELVSGIVFRLEDGITLKIEGWVDFCHVSCVDSDDEDMTIPFSELKKGLFNWEDLHIDEVSGLESHSGTLYFGSLGEKHCEGPFMTLVPDGSASRIHIRIDDLTLLGWCIGDLFERFDSRETYEYTAAQWTAILDEAEKLLSFASFDELFDHRIALAENIRGKSCGSYFLLEMNHSGKIFWKRRDTWKEQLEEIRQWTALVLKENDLIKICQL